MPATRTARRLGGLPILPALVLCACGPQSGTPPPGESVCAKPSIGISAVQGSGDHSPLLGETVRVRGVVTARSSDGLFLESTTPDADPATSEALFLADPVLAAERSPGDLISVAGVVHERGTGGDTQTSLGEIHDAGLCGEDAPLPLRGTDLPLSDTQRESLENMRLSFGQELKATDVYRLERGDVTVSLETILPAPTEVALPGDDAREQARRNRLRSIHLRLVPGDRAAFPVDSTVPSLRGVLGHDGQGPRLILEDRIAAMPPAAFPVQPPQAGHIRVVSLNLHNYFNGDGRGGGFPTPRGAATPAAFAGQRERLAAALARLEPQLVAVMELENDGFGSTSAAENFLEDLAGALPAPWEAVDPGVERVGGDAITVGLFYRSDSLAPVGPAALLATGPFRDRSRVPIAQAFVEHGGGMPFLVAVNHFKSKGSCPESGPDADRRDGQGCWNATRLASARSLISWINPLAARIAEGRALVLGDFNAYHLEDPVRFFVEAGYADLTAYGAFGFEYSYVYRGEAGTLDYAFASAALRPLVWRAEIPHLNSGYPPGVPLDTPWLRSSDHDPVVVDLRLRHSATAP